MIFLEKLFQQSTILSSPGEKNPCTEKTAEAFNDYFANIGKNIKITRGPYKTYFNYKPFQGAHIKPVMMKL